MVYFIRPGIVRYDGCFIDTTGGAMDMGTGIFSVAEAGIYQLTFTAKYVSSNRGRFGAWSDMYVNQKVSTAKSQFLYALLVLSALFWGFPVRCRHFFNYFCVCSRLNQLMRLLSTLSPWSNKYSTKLDNNITA